jgi:hypothetical protein
MNRLEMDARPLLTPLFHAEKIVLRPDDQAVIAAWAAKTALMLEFVTLPRHRGADAQHYKDLAAQRRAPEKVHVWLARYEGPAHVQFAHLPLDIADDATGPPPHPNGFVVALIIRRLVTYVMGHSHPQDLYIDIEGDAGKAVTQIWPKRNITWPPFFAFDDASVATFFDGFAPRLP